MGMKRADFKPPVEMECPICGEKFKRYASQIRHRGARWCSYACQRAGEQARRKTARCKHCGDRFFVKNANDLRRGKFCSRECWANFKAARPATVALICAQCGAKFERYNSQVRKGTRRVFCSDACARLGRRRGQRLPNRGAVWDRLSAEMRERDGHLCVRCGQPEPSSKSLNVDHIIPARLLLDRPVIADDPRNLASLCTACHAIKTHRYEPRILRGDFLAIEEFYDHETRLRVMELWAAA